MTSKAQPSPPTSCLCVIANGPLCLDSPCVQSCETRFPCRSTKLKAADADSSVSPVPETHMARWKRQRNVLGVLGVHVDDLVGGGNLVFQKAVQRLRTELEFGTWDQSRFRFRG